MLCHNFYLQTPRIFENFFLNWSENICVDVRSHVIFWTVALFPVCVWSPLYIAILGIILKYFGQFNSCKTSYSPQSPIIMYYPNAKRLPLPIEETPQPATQNPLQSSSYLWLFMHIPWVLNIYKLFHLNRSIVSASNRPPPSQLCFQISPLGGAPHSSLFKSLLSTPRSSPLPPWWFNCRTQSSDDCLSDLDFITFHLSHIYYLFFFFWFSF